MPSPLRLIRLLRARVRSLFRHDAVAGEIREELDFHLQMRTQEYRRSGETETEAVRHARRRLGNVAVLQDQGYDIRGAGLIETIGQDVRYAVRQLSRQPGFTILAIGTLALGIGLSTALFSVIDAAMLHPLPYPHPEQLVQVLINVPQPSGRAVRLSPSIDDVRFIRASGHTLPVVGSIRSVFEPLIVDGPEPERIRGEEIDEGYLTVCGVTPIIGRGIEARDLSESAAPVVVLGYGYWQRKYGGSPDVLGSVLKFDTGAATIVGVLPPGFDRDIAFVRPLKMTSAFMAVRGSGANVFGRLQPSADIEQTAKDLTGLLKAAPRERPGQSVVLRRQLEQRRESYRTTIQVLVGAVALILLIGCVDVAGLLLARGTVRLPELAIRASIGAGRWRLVRQLVTESLVLSLSGAVVGVVLARWSLRTLVANIPMTLPADAPATLNLRVLVGALALSCVVGLLFGLVPALRLTRPSALELLQGGRAGSPLTRRVSSLLIASEVALAIVLMAGAALMLRSFGRMVSVDLGFRPEAIVTLDAQPIDSSPGTIGEYYPALLGRVRSLPGVQAAGAIDQLPLGPSSSVAIVTGTVRAGVAVRTVLPGYFEAIGLPLKEGRLPVASDTTSAFATAIVDEAAVKRLFPDGSAVGRQLTFATGRQTLVVVGVVGTVRFWGPLIPADPVVYRVLQPGKMSADQTPRTLTVVVRPSDYGPSLAPALRDVAVASGTRVILSPVRSGDNWLQDTVVTPRRRTVLLSLLGGLGLMLTLVGIFGMTAYSVARRTREIGVRMAMGATARNILFTMLADTVRPIAMGIAIGLVAAALSTRVIASFLFETTPTDATTFALVAGAIALAGLTAAWIPSRRALRIDPVRALRTE